METLRVMLLLLMGSNCGNMCLDKTKKKHTNNQENKKWEQQTGVRRAGGCQIADVKFPLSRFVDIFIGSYIWTIF